MTVEYCPTEEMWCDVLTKPKQGLAFRKDRAMLMNCPVDWTDICEGEQSPQGHNPPPRPTGCPTSTLTGKARLLGRVSPQECVGGGVPSQ